MRTGGRGGTRFAVLVSAAAAFVVLAARHSPTAQPAREAQATAHAFERDVTPFAVLDEHGRPYTLPFLGGMNVPRPQFVDIDADGDLDLFIHEYSSALWFLENVGSAAAPRFAWRTDRYHDLDIAEWNRFVDLDRDGDFDLLAELRYSYVRVFRNTGTARAAAFRADPDTLRTARGEALFADRQNIPALVDLDCNGRLDLFIGRVDGTVARYEATGASAERFALLTERFENIEIIGDVDSTGTRHGANTMAFADADQDGDLDLYWGDFFERGVLYIENRGTACATPALRTEPVPVPGADSLNTSGFNVPILVDLDADGDLDFLMGVLGGAFNPIRSASDNFYYWERVNGGRLILRTRRFLNGIDLGSESAPAFVDLDGDGDLDMVAGSKIDPHRSETARLHVFHNEGTAAAPAFRLADTLDLAIAYHQSPAFGDLDGDGDPDLLLGTWNQDVLFFRNAGSRREPRFVQDTAATIRLPRAGNAMPALADIDGDGDLDLFVGEASGDVNYLRNDGTRHEPRFVLVSERVDDIDAGRRSAPALIDLDGDGLLDLVLGREDAGLIAFRNAGTRTGPRFVPMPEFTIATAPFSAPAFADLDRDGRIDLVNGTLGGGLQFFRGRARH